MHRSNQKVVQFKLMNVWKRLIQLGVFDQALAKTVIKFEVLYQ